MRRRDSPNRSAQRAQMVIYFLQRSEEARERIVEARRVAPTLGKITRSKLIRGRDRRRAHGAIFVGALRPGDALRVVDPEREAHARYGVTAASRCCRASAAADRSMVAPVYSTTTITSHSTYFKGSSLT